VGCVDVGVDVVGVVGVLGVVRVAVVGVDVVGGIVVGVEVVGVDVVGVDDELGAVVGSLDVTRYDTETLVLASSQLRVKTIVTVPPREPDVAANVAPFLSSLFFVQSRPTLSVIVQMCCAHRLSVTRKVISSPGL
jgi:hypothetical protein